MKSVIVPWGILLGYKRAQYISLSKCQINTLSWKHMLRTFILSHTLTAQIARFMGPTWDPPGADRTQVGPCWSHEPCFQGVVSAHMVWWEFIIMLRLHHCVTINQWLASTLTKVSSLPSLKVDILTTLGVPLTKISTKWWHLFPFQCYSTYILTPYVFYQANSLYLRYSDVLLVYVVSVVIGKLWNDMRIHTYVDESQPLGCLAYGKCFITMTS